MDCQKLSLDAGMHAAQNERLPLRVVVQVLFSEQVKISNALASSSSSAASALLANKAAADAVVAPLQPPMSRRQLLDGTPQSFQEGWAVAKKDINTLKFELESMKAKYLELQHEMDALQKVVERGGAPSPAAGPKAAAAGVGGKNQSQGPSAWSSGWKKLGRLAKMSGGDGAGQDGHVPGAPGEAPRKPRGGETPSREQSRAGASFVASSVGGRRRAA